MRLGLPLEEFNRVSSDYKPRTHPVTEEKQKMHNGLDLAAPIGREVYASERGVAIMAGQNDPNIEKKLGNVIVIDHTPKAGADGWHLYTTYGHLREVKPFAGDIKGDAKVEKGQLIGYVGETGVATGPHLHFGVAYIKKKLKIKTGGGATGIEGSDYSDPIKYINIHHKIKGTTDDLTDEEADRLIDEKISFELEYRFGSKFRLAVLVDGVIKNYIDKDNLNVDVVLEYEYEDEELEKLMASPAALPKKSAPINLDFSIKL